jgi:hypothetical protein
MQGVFDHHDNYLNANIISPLRGPILYTITTKNRLWRGRSSTAVERVERVLGCRTKGSISWKKGKLEVNGKRAKKGGISRECGFYMPQYPGHAK